MLKIINTNKLEKYIHDWLNDIYLKKGLYEITKIFQSIIDDPLNNNPKAIMIPDDFKFMNNDGYNRIMILMITRRLFKEKLDKIMIDDNKTALDWCKENIPKLDRLDEYQSIFINAIHKHEIYFKDE